MSAYKIGHIVQSMNDSSIDTNAAAGGPSQGGPPLALLASISLALLLAGLVVGVVIAGGIMPLPYGSEILA